MTRLPKRMSGASKLAREWNLMVDCLTRQQVKPAPGTRTTTTTRGTFISATPAKGGAGTSTGDDNLTWI